LTTTADTTLATIEELGLELLPKAIAAIANPLGGAAAVAVLAEPQIVAALGLLQTAILDAVRGKDAAQIRQDFDDGLVQMLVDVKFPTP
jgi:hypothetical protein